MSRHEEFYQKKLIVFLDILGFSNIVEESVNKPSRIWEIWDFLDISAHLLNGISNYDIKIYDVDPKQYRYYAFSDSIMVTCPYKSYIDFLVLCSFLMYYQYKLWSKKTFLRGVIVLDDLYEEKSENKEIVFGPGIIKAYNLEESLARWPRILIDDSVLCTKTVADKQYDSIEYLQTDSKGLTFVDYLRFLFHMFAFNDDLDSKIFYFIDPFKIFERHKLAIKRAKIIEHQDKYLPLVNYHNSTISRYRDLIQQLLNKEEFFMRTFQQVALLTRFSSYHTMPALGDSNQNDQFFLISFAWTKIKNDSNFDNMKAMQITPKEIDNISNSIREKLSEFDEKLKNTLIN